MQPSISVGQRERGKNGVEREWKVGWSCRDDVPMKGKNKFKFPVLMARGRFTLSGIFRISTLIKKGISFFTAKADSQKNYWKKIVIDIHIVNLCGSIFFFLGLRWYTKITLLGQFDPKLMNFDKIMISQFRKGKYSQNAVFITSVFHFVYVHSVSSDFIKFDKK